ncbi:MAG TPA: thioredoxin family protein [Fimbriimonas sp.]|nr:thioredoxin family protein [Fimbriimonas sp.]
MVTQKLLTALLLATTAGISAAQEFPWRTNEKTAFEEAKAQKKPVMVYFTTSWCGWCKIMEQQTFSKPTVIKQAQAYIPLKLDAEKEGKNLAAKYKVHAYPHFIFVNPDGTTKGSVLGFQDETGFLEKVKVILLPKSEMERLTAALKANPNDGPANCGMAMLLLEQGKLEEADKRLSTAATSGYKGADLAAGLSQLAYAMSTSNPKRMMELYQASIKLKDRNSLSITYERIMQWAAQNGNIATMVATAEDILKSEHISPELMSKAEKLIKGRKQQDKLTTPETLLKELEVQFSAQTDRDNFYFKNLFFDDAAFTALYRQSNQTWRWVVDQTSYLDTFGTDKLQTKYELVDPIITKANDIAMVKSKFKVTSTLANGEISNGGGTVILVLINQGGRWYIQSYCQEVG